MAIKCSLLGHKFGDPEVEREREEQGSEVVTTIREVETCSRCGTDRVVSENKEVTTLETPDDVPVDTESSAEGPSPGVGTDGPAGEGDDAEVMDDTEDEETPDTADAEADDAEVVEDDAPAAGPDIADAEEDAEEAYEPPESPEEDDGVILEDDTEDDEGVDRSPGEWPEEPADEDTSEWEPETEEEAEVDPDPEVETAGSGSVTVPDGSFHCPECGFSEPVEASSLRAGDSCPECHRGYLQHESGEA
jgi:ssDNA-binding Zn-finger/Zn-ribbon topoisomerase 1